jgi:hypothetical protein
LHLNYTPIKQLDMSENNFKDLEDEMESKYPASQDKIKNNVDSQRGFWALVADLIELYVPKILSTFANTTTPTYENGIQSETTKTDSEHQQD